MKYITKEIVDLVHLPSCNRNQSNIDDVVAVTFVK